MTRVILSDDRQYRYNEAIKCLEGMLMPEYVGNEHINRTYLRSIERHLAAAGVTMGILLEDFFQSNSRQLPTATPEEAEAHKCACNRVFQSAKALNGHRRTCKLHKKDETLV